MRHKDPLLCSHGALAQYLFWRFHISGEDAPSFQRRKDWYDVKALVTTARSAKATSQRTSRKRKSQGEDTEKVGGGVRNWTETELAYLAQLQEIMRIFEAAAISSVEKTHAMRGCAARAAELHGVAEPQVSPPSPSTSTVC